MDTQTVSKQHIPMKSSSLSLAPLRYHGVITVFGWLQILGCYWRFVIGAEWLQTGCSHVEDLVCPTPANVVAFWQVRMGSTAWTSHLAWLPVLHNNSYRLRHDVCGALYCLCVSLGCWTATASCVFWLLSEYTSVPSFAAVWMKGIP